MGAVNCKPCRKKKKALQGGSILDRVISQASNQDQCLLYRLANYKKGGELIDAYNQGGFVEVEKLIRDQFGQLMYREGKGQIINRSNTYGGNSGTTSKSPFPSKPPLVASIH
nr:unnamed protein product [Callosobruchus chinensis]